MVELTEAIATVGPVILIDKSVLQSLTNSEAAFLGKHYSLNVPPVLLNEIRADLTKDDDVLRGEASRLARKLHLIPDRWFCVPRQWLMRQDLLQGNLEMAHRPHVLGNAVGGGGFMVDDTLESKLFAWSQGQFTEMDAAQAASWRLSMAQTDLEGIGREVRNSFERGEWATSGRALDLINEMLADPNVQEELVRWMLGSSQASPEERQAVWERWQRTGENTLKRFAPYANYCAQVHLLFQYALGASMVSTRASGAVDLEYLLYLPFCQVFSSGDRLHQILAPYLVDGSQVLVWRDDMKNDLGELEREWEERAEAERSASASPPETPTTITRTLWNRFMEGN